MKRLKNIVLASLLAPSLFTFSVSAAECNDFTNQDVRKLRSKESINLCQFKDKPLLIVNTASNCGFTPQFEQLEALHKEYKEQGLVVLGFPSDSFFQEENDEKDTAEMCFINYGVTFNMMATSDVKGSDANPIFKHLADKTRSPSWNFNKYLVSKDRQTVTHFGSRVKPQSDELKQAIEKAL
ncbi:hypothetical protein AN214_03570 [Pseudoalteromonas sp. P1-9]|uniref:glutathione peroxidase n=1 Tax=Pseudoalteromonas sp. P1-9 TaxID=1710354 RepID=UPI0006D64EA3|nr:glutathione peroxidase [Pseudoalteromonas sp. P1-9]KPV94392.1 hypothetical protein AN214_03570 [Pseudoalteromonas sp. P1-9]